MSLPLLPAPRFTALAVDHDPQIRHLLERQLGRSGYRVDLAANGEQALTQAGARGYDVVLLDLDLPSFDGLSLCRAIRASVPNRTTPIVLLSQRRDESDTVLGLESGADDYVVKPFGVRELVARVGAIVRRRVWAGTPPAAAGLVLDRARRQVSLDGRAVPTTRQEFDLLDYLAARPAAVVTRDALLQNVWRGDARVTARTVDAVVCRVRRKIERDPRHPARLVTAWGVGYTLREPTLGPARLGQALRPGL